MYSDFILRHVQFYSEDMNKILFWEPKTGLTTYKVFPLGVRVQGDLGRHKLSIIKKSEVGDEE